MEKIKSEIRYY